MLTLLVPGALWLLLTLPVIVLLFLVRERKRRQEVSALFLWTEAKVAARRRRRVAPALLLLVQLLLAALLAFALAQPRLRLTGAPPRILVIDASASMAAIGPDGSRLAEAVAEAERVLGGAGEVAVVRAGLGAQVVQPLTGDHTRVRRALATLVAADARAELGSALSLARSLAPAAEVHLFSDQARPAGFGDVAVHAVGRPLPNVGISAFEVAYGQLFVSVVGNSEVPQNVELIVTGEPNDSEAGSEAVGRAGENVGNANVGNEVRTGLLVPARGQANTSLPLASEGLYRARVEGVASDALALDDEAFAGSRALNVQLVGDAPALERLLRALPNTTTATGTAETVSETPVDITVSVGQTGALPPGNLVLFAPPTDAPGYREIVSWARGDPLLRFVDLTGVVVAPAGTPLPLPLAGAEVLARTADLTPVLLRWREGGRTVLYFSFHPAQSDLARRPAFPIVWANILEGFRSEAQVPLGTALVGGGTLAEPGRLERPGRSYTSAPLPASESRLEVTATTSAGERLQSSSAATRDPALWLVVGALLLLLSEWLLWSRDRGFSRAKTSRSVRP